MNRLSFPSFQRKACPASAGGVRSTGLSEHYASKQLEDLHYKAQRGGSKTIARLKLLIEKYPGVPQLKNFLSVAYLNSDNIEKAREVNHLIVKEHPDYLFGKLNLAFEYYNEKQYDKIPEVVGSLMEIQDLYSDRDCFHLTEVTSFNRLAIMYYCAVGNLKAAESRYEMLKELAPEHPDTKEVLPYLIIARLESAQKRMEKGEKSRIRKHTVSPDVTGENQQSRPGEEPSKIAQKPGRNDPCPCGSGKKYKKCCLDKED